MAELDTIIVYNPTDTDFTARFNGEPYTVPAKGQKEWAQFLALHVAKHFSDFILQDEVDKINKKKTDSPFRPEIGQLLNYDNPKRRISLYRILRNKENVERVVTSFPFKGFIGEMSEYEDFVAKEANAKVKPKEEEPQVAKTEE